MRPLTKRAFSTDLRNLGTGGVKRPPFPTAQSVKPMGDSIKNLNKPGGGMTPKVAAARVKLRKLAELTPANDNVALPRVLPDPAEAHSNPRTVAGAGDPLDIPEENRRAEATLSAAAETESDAGTSRYLQRHFAMGKTPTRKVPNKDLQFSIMRELTDAGAQSFGEGNAVPLDSPGDQVLDAAQEQGGQLKETAAEARFPYIRENLVRTLTR